MRSWRDFLVAFLQAGYGLLLRLYPRSFRDQFAQEMRGVFGATLAEAAAHGPAAVAEVWFREIGTYPANLARAYFNSWGEVKVARARRPGLLFLATWTFLSALAPVAALAVSFLLFRVLIDVLGPTVVRYGYSSPTEDALGLFIFFPLLGLILGSVQALLLGRYVAGAWRWLLAIVAGWATVSILNDLTVATARLTTIELSQAVRTWAPLVALGLLSGGLQWLSFRRDIPGAIWFLFAGLLGVAWIPAAREHVGGASILWQGIGMTAAPGFVSGLALMLLLRNRSGASPGAATRKEREGEEGGVKQDAEQTAGGRAEKLSDPAWGGSAAAVGAYVRTFLRADALRKGGGAP